MQITCPAFEHNQTIPRKYTCDGENINPPLEFSDVPEAAQSLVLVMDDPDAPAGLWVHWTLWNIDPKISEIPEDSVPEGAVQGATNRDNHYGGPCPPDREHRYFFKLYALKSRLDLDASADKAALEAAMADQVIEQAELIGLYNRR
ncbi:MAG: YbhB/YbcL family Raf kinase inhibitor-like protein [Candidatus Doudnabacteria bacterium]|nr:YbhB/YbcL family Raf kinase inhibitor-like protein [Candidatus Doudnabacteria bacterium]